MAMRSLTVNPALTLTKIFYILLANILTLSYLDLVWVYNFGNYIQSSLCILARTAFPTWQKHRRCKVNCPILLIFYLPDSTFDNRDSTFERRDS